MEDFDIGNIIDSDDNEEHIRVESPSGSHVMVMSPEEEEYYNQMSARYQADNMFKNISDILELDRILLMETMCYRWSLWILAEHDYSGKKINPTDIQKYIETYSKEIRGIKKDLGIDKSSRDKDSGESIAEYINMLGIRAREFGVVRNKQAVEAITILMELKGIMTLYDNSTDSERLEFKCTEKDIMAWIFSKFEDFDRIDDALRKEQALWIRDI